MSRASFSGFLRYSQRNERHEIIRDAEVEVGPWMRDTLPPPRAAEEPEFVPLLANRALLKAAHRAVRLRGKRLET